MIRISDAQPIQFWPTGRQTFNEFNDGGMSLKDCFCQQVECDDEITVQFTSDEIADFRLVIGLDTGADLAQVNFTRQELNPTRQVYTATLVMSDYGGCIERQVSFRISKFT